jgi:hypothetical protein
MSEFTEKLHDLKPTREKGKIPREDGRYVLPDRRVLIREGDRFILLGHRDKKEMKRLLQCGAEVMRRLLSLPSNGGHTRDQLKPMTDEMLARLLVPRPRAVFNVSWLCTSGCNKAQQLRKLARQAETQ